MIYTIGHRESYLKYFKELVSSGCPPMKKGRTNMYSGGSVWQTHEEALSHADPRGEYSVFGVMADWEKDTVPSELGDWHDLLYDRELVCLDS